MLSDAGQVRPPAVFPRRRSAEIGLVPVPFSVVRDHRVTTRLSSSTRPSGGRQELSLRAVGLRVPPMPYRDVPDDVVRSAYLRFRRSPVNSHDGQSALVSGGSFAARLQAALAATNAAARRQTSAAHDRAAFPS